MIKHILAGEVWTPTQHLSNQVIHIADGKITGLETASTFQQDDKTLDARDAIVIPGLVDLQVNGAMGWSFQASHREHYDDILQFHLKNGTTTLLPTLVTANKSTLLDSLRSVAEYIDSETMITLPGIHLEGPFLAPEKSGAHDKQALCLPDITLADQFFNAAEGKIVMTTLAPELPGALEIISYYADKDIVVSAGHSAATYDSMRNAITAGLSFVTHAGNASDWPHRAMGKLGFLASEPGIIGALMTEPPLGGSMILDGFHFHPALVRPLIHLKSVDNLVLISDASTVAGCAPGEYQSGGLIVNVNEAGFATSGRGGGWLAGSTIPLLRAVQVAVAKANVSLHEAVTMATLTPAKWLRIDDRKGQIRVGADADILVLDQDLRLRSTIYQGTDSTF